MEYTLRQALKYSVYVQRKIKNYSINCLIILLFTVRRHPYFSFQTVKLLSDF